MSFETTAVPRLHSTSLEHSPACHILANYLYIEIMTFQDPDPAEVFDLASRLAALLRALQYHPGTAFNGDKVTDPKDTHPTLYQVTDFVQRTYLRFLVPLLPPNATKTSRALANPWSYQDPDFEGDPKAMADEKYPEINKELWKDSNSRATMIGMIIIDPKKQAMFGGSFDFGEDVYRCARALYSPALEVRPENVVKLATLAGVRNQNEGNTE